jgi:glucokinase
MRVGIDIGGTKIVAGVVGGDGVVVHSKRIATQTEKGYDGVKEDIIRLVRTVLDEAHIAARAVEQIGIATAGQIEKVSKKILFSPNMGWRNVPLKDDIENAFGIKTCIENDVNAATYGEWKFGLKGVPQDVLGIFIGTGIGGGLILDGKLYRGFSNVGAEVGHTIVNPYGYRCNCGNNGCFEAYCGGAYIVERVKKKIEEGYRGKIFDLIAGDMEHLHTGIIEEAYLLGDDLCVHVWQEVVEYLGAGVASLVNLLNPQIVVFGGGVINGTKYLIDEMNVVLKKRAMDASLKGLEIKKAALGENAALLGVSYIEE